MSDWFKAHKQGLRQIAERLVESRGFGIIGGELYQNVMDTDATKCEIIIEKLPHIRAATLEVIDDDPTGFVDLSHAWTIFAPSLKKNDPTKAGRFNVGEKLALSFCRQAEIHTTTGMVIFDESGRKDYPRRRRERGTKFSAVIDCTQEQLEQFLHYMRKVLVRPGLELTVNGELILPRTPVHVFSEKLQTEIAGKDGFLRKTIRLCEVELYEPFPDETPMLYELGIPVVETRDRWHYNVKQKVPLNVDRDNVTPAYLRALRVCVFNEMHNKITEEDTTAAWVNDAADDERCTDEAAETFRVKKFGKKSVALDPTNPEANAEAVASGYLVIPPRGLTTGQRQNLRRAGTLLTSSQEFPLAGRNAYSNDPNALPVEIIPISQWTSGMRAIHEYTVGVAERLIHRSIRVEFVNSRQTNSFDACYLAGDNGYFHYNVGSLGKNWFNQGVTEEVDSLIIHELGHEFESNHLSREYYRALTRLGARLKSEVLKDPDWFKKFMYIYDPSGS